jgi:hypothetical protein
MVIAPQLQEMKGMTVHDTTRLESRIGRRIWLADGGLETLLLFHEGLDLPAVAAFPLLWDPRGRDR